VRAHGRSVPGRVVPLAAGAGVGSAASDRFGAPAGAVRPGGDCPGAVRLELEEPVHGLALGQAAVVYDAADERCLGGGRVTAAERPAGLPVVAGV
jgi:hypothetical protein